MAIIYEEVSKKEHLQFIPSKRCDDYDDDCIHVANHAQCWIGGTFIHWWGVNELPPVDGYCPFVCGMIKNPG